eukprot:10350422-Ditylum_brightwellii.AAC.1
MGQGVFLQVTTTTKLSASRVITRTVATFPNRGGNKSKSWGSCDADSENSGTEEEGGEKEEEFPHKKQRRLVNWSREENWKYMANALCYQKDKDITRGNVFPARKSSLLASGQV